MRTVVIGSGIGGLLTASFLAKNNYDVTVLEKSPRIGGRFMNLPYKGFELSTGAFHMVPHGEDGPFAHLLKVVGSDVEIVNSEPKGMISHEGRTFHYREGWKYLSVIEKARAMKLLFNVKMNRVKLDDPLMSGREWLRESIGDNEFVDLFIRSYLGWADSVTDVPAGELVKEIRAALIWGGPGLIKGGCRAVVESLAGITQKHGGRVSTRRNVVEIDPEKKIILMEDGAKLEYDVLISDVGVKETVELIGRDNFDRGYLKTVDSLKPSEGIKYNVALRGKPRIGNTVVFTLDTQRINGYNEPSSLSLELAREGYTLIMLHHALQGRNVKAEQRKGIDDVYRLFSNLDRNGEVLLVQTYLDGNPVNRVASGQAVGDFPIGDVYIVGDAFRPPGGIEVEGIALGVMRVLERMGIANFHDWKL